jgi:predicted dehydrogenase
MLTRSRLLAADPRVEVVGFVESDDAIADEIERNLGLVRYGSLSALLESRIDLVVVEAIDPWQMAMAEQCVGLVRGMLLEKPGTSLPREAYGLSERCERAGMIVEFGYQLHYAESISRLRDVVASGCLGQITQARFHGGCPAGAALDPWQSLPEDLGGFGYTIGCHVIEWVVSLFGIPLQVSGLARRLPPGEVIDSPFYRKELFSGRKASSKVQVGTCMYEDVAAAVLLYKDKLVSMDLTAWEAQDWVRLWRVELYGTNGTAQAMGSEDVSVELREARGDYVAGTTKWRPAPPSRDYPYERQLDGVIKRLQGAEYGKCVGLDIGIAVLRVLDAMFSSVATDGVLQNVSS